MPLNKRKYAAKRKVIRRKRFARRRGYITSNPSRSLQPVAQRTIVKMKYCEALNVQIPAFGVVQSQVWNLNSIFDPNRTGLGHQPYGHDTFLTLYNRYRVIGCSYAINIAQQGDTATNQLPVVLGALPSNEVDTVSNMSELREKPRSKYIVQMYGSPSRTLRGYVSIPSLIGRTKAQYMADDRFQAQFGASPSESAILNTYIGMPNDNSVGGSMLSVQYSITLVYHVECFDPKVLPQS